MTRDPFLSLETLRARRWNGGAHRNELEETLMLAHAKKHLVTLTKAKALLAAVALLIFGGLAGAGTAHLFHRLSVEETRLEDGRSHVRVKDEAGTTVFDGVLEEGDGLFVIEGDEDENETVTHLRPVGDDR